MKNTILAVAFTLIAMQSYTQTAFQGVAIYESKTSTAEFTAGLSGDKDMTPEMQKTIEEQMKSMFQKTFVLNFNQSASIYKEQEKLESPNPNDMQMVVMVPMMGGGGTLYKNIKEKNYMRDEEFMGKEFLIQDSLPKYQWKLTNETRVIGGYTCYKATAVLPTNQSDFRNFLPPTHKESTVSEEITTMSTPVNEFKNPTQTIITAWFTPEISISQGPDHYWGLPGLILEVYDGTTTILCSKIILNSKEKVAIKAPNKGKVISQKTFDETVVKKLEEVRQMNQSQGFEGNTIRFGR